MQIRKAGDHNRVTLSLNNNLIIKEMRKWVRVPLQSLKHRIGFFATYFCDSQQ